MSSSEAPLVREGYDSDEEALAASRAPSLPRTMADVTAYSDTYRSRKHNRELYLKPYWKTLLIAAIYYVIPSMEFVIYQYQHLDDTICYYNEMCMRPALGFVAFNNVASNLVYITLGFLWILFVWVNSLAARKIPDNVGLGRDFSLYYCMGGAMIYEGIFSGLYHICPSPVNFQFDTAFMIIGGGLTFLTVYAKRHPIYLAGASRVFAFFALFILLDTLSLLKLPSLVFWTVAILFLTYVITQGSIYLYYHRVIRLWRCEERYCQSLVEFYYHLKSDNWSIRHKPSFFMLLFAITINYAYFFYAAYQGFYYAETQDFPFFLLSLIIGNCFIYLAFYIIMKHVEGEKVYFVNWMLVLLNLFFWGSGYYYYQVLAVTNKFLTPAQSSQLNKPCALFDYFDYHDAWHMLSGLGLFTLFCLVFSLDIDIRHTPRERINVF